MYAHIQPWGIDLSCKFIRDNLRRRGNSERIPWRTFFFPWLQKNSLVYFYISFDRVILFFFYWKLVIVSYINICECIGCSVAVEELKEMCECMYVKLSYQKFLGVTVLRKLFYRCGSRREMNRLIAFIIQKVNVYIICVYM